jgi:hypothetical protein
LENKFNIRLNKLKLHGVYALLVGVFSCDVLCL